ncbi:MAG: glycine betaine ABC transporter substrate-binding protein, partial [Prochlorotrichaceae cyanobacterium]
VDNRTVGLCRSGCGHWDRADNLGIQTISDLVAQASDLVMIGPPEFMVREDGLPGLKETYGDFELKNYVAVDSGLRYQGLQSGEADVVVGFGTDGEISAYNLTVLEDNLQFFPPYQVAPVVCQESLDRFPTLEIIHHANAETTPRCLTRRTIADSLTPAGPALNPSRRSAG